MWTSGGIQTFPKTDENCPDVCGRFEVCGKGRCVRIVQGSTGVNGTAPGAVNCNDIFHKFDGTWYKSTGSGMLPAFPNGDFIKLNEVYFLKCGDQREHYRWSMLHEVHAETNALGRAAKLGTSTEGADAYITYSPCPDCAKALAVAGIANIYYLYQFDWLETITEFLEGYGVNLLPMNKEWLS